MKTVSENFNNIGKAFKSIAKIMVQSGPVSIKHRSPKGPLIILANGPSLNATISESLHILKGNDTMSVNFAPNTDVFFLIRPKYHVLADPLFFAEEKASNIVLLYEQLAKVDWDLTLLVPRKFVKRLPETLLQNTAIKVETFNFVGVEGPVFFENILMGRKVGMPRPRNVLIPALMCGIWLGYEEIYITGADHSWMQTISVNDENHVVSVQPHFYKDDHKERQRIDSAYTHYRLHQIVESFAVAFRSYHHVESFARNQGVRIFNSTPGSFIDAFIRKPLPVSL